MAGTRKNIKSFDQEMNTLSGMTEKLSSGELSLEESMRVYEEGMRLAEKLAKDLTALEARLEQIDVKTGDISAVKLEEEDVKSDE